MLFPYLRYWPHISSSGGAFSFNKGINFDSSQIYDYRKDKPYSALFISGNVSSFLVPEEMLNTRVSEVLSNNSYILPNPTGNTPPPALSTPIVKANQLIRVINIAGIDVDFVSVENTTNLTVSKYEITYQLFEKFKGKLPVKKDCKNHLGTSTYTSNWITPGYLTQNNAPVTCITPEDINSFIQWANKNSSPATQFSFIKTNDWLKMKSTFLDSKKLCDYNILDKKAANIIPMGTVNSSCLDDGFIYVAEINKIKDKNKVVGLRGNVREIVFDCINSTCLKYKVAGGSWRSNDDLSLKNYVEHENDLGFRIKIK